MKIRNVQNRINFGRSLMPDEANAFSSVRDEAKKLAGQTGRSILIVHDACLPQVAERNTGVGNLTSQESMKFFDTMKLYTGVNEIKVLPQNQYYGHDGKYIAYGCDSTTLGSHVIDMNLLTTSDYGSILTKEEFDSIVRANYNDAKTKQVNYENVIKPNSPNERALKNAHERFRKLPENHPLKTKFNAYFAENKQRLEDNGLYDYLTELHGDRNYEKWNHELDRNLYNPDFNPPEKAARLKEVKNLSKNSVEFHSFKQFIADEHLERARNMLHEKGLKLNGDCPQKFSPNIIWRHPKAFRRDFFVGDISWQFIAPDFEQLKDTNSEMSKLLKEKVQFFAKRYDTVRFDASWNYVQPKLISRDGRYVTKPEYGGKILDMIDDYVKEVKGKDFDLSLITHEFEADPVDFGMFKDGRLRESVRKRTKVVGTTYMSNDWGSNHAFKNVQKWDANSFIVGVGNHDPQPLRQLANNAADNQIKNGRRVAEFHKFQQIEPLSNILKISKEALGSPINFAKAKFAEIMMAKNNFLFYMDVFGRAERFDQQAFNTRESYRYKIPADFEKSYISAIREGYGFNIMDALEKVFTAKGLDKTNPELFEKIVKFKNILNEAEAVKPMTATPEPAFIKSGSKLKPVLAAAALLVGIGVIIMLLPSNNKS